MKNSFKEVSQKFNEWLHHGDSDRVKNYIDLENNKFNSDFHGEYKVVPTIMHFIWLGCINKTNLDYLFIWKSIGVKFVLWVDHRTKYNSLLVFLINDIKKRENVDLIGAQNFLFMYATKVKAKNLNELVLWYSDNFLPSLMIEIKRIDVEYEECISYLSVFFTLKDLSEETDLFYDDDFKRFYLYETILRNNLAAASDIVRIFLLWKYGGIYVDVDTLPFINADYHEIKSKYNVPDSIINLFDVYVSFNLLKKHGFDFEFNYEKLDYCKCIISSVNTALIDCLDNLIKDGLYFSIFNFPIVHTSLLCISASKNNELEFNNNILACHPKSRAIRIILREMKKRYCYCEKNGIIFFDKSLMKKQNNKYYSRLTNYRCDGIENGDEATLVLSGPSLILEVVLGLAYKIAELSDIVQPEAVSYAMRIKNYCLSFEEQTMFTIKHIDSSWMAQ